MFSTYIEETVEPYGGKERVSIGSKLEGTLSATSLDACLSVWPLRARLYGFMVLGRLGAVPLAAIQMGLKSDCAMCTTSPESMATPALGVKRIGMVG
jgi:hypothetical protein